MYSVVDYRSTSTRVLYLIRQAAREVGILPRRLFCDARFDVRGSVCYKVTILDSALGNKPRALLVSTTCNDTDNSTVVNQTLMQFTGLF